VGEMNYPKAFFSIFFYTLLFSTAVSAQTESIDAYLRDEMERSHIPGLSPVVVKM
jgi:hypothetical protein